MPLARILVFALALTHAVGVADLMMGDGCEARCADDGCGPDCPPGPACRCHGPSAVPLLGGRALAVTKLATPRLEIAFPDEQRMHASPDPREILRVPKLAG